MRARLSLTAGLVLAALTAATLPASATEFCEVVKTKDGFVALRGAPDPSGKLIARMKGGDEVQLSQGKRGGWQRVVYWPAGDRITGGEKARKVTGWVNAKLIDVCG
jgi:hypothetical protein